MNLNRNFNTFGNYLNKPRSRYNKDYSTKNKIFKLNIYYEIPEFAGNTGGPNNDGFYLFSEKKESSEYQFIRVGDKIQYNNPKHPNHLKKGVVRKYNRRAEFEIIFNDPPFLYEKDKKTGKRFKTNKKIKVIENVKFENLRKIDSNTGSLFIKQAVIRAGIKNKYNLREFFDTPLKDFSEEYSNETLLLYRTLLFLFDIDLGDNKIDYQNKVNGAILDMVSPKKKNLPVLLQIKDKFLKMKEKGDNLYLDIKDFLLTFKDTQANFTEKLKKEEEFIEKGKKDRKENATLANAFAFFERLLEVFKKKQSRQVISYKVEDLGILNRAQYYTFLKNLRKKKDEIEAKQFLTYQDVIEKKIKEKLRNIFLKGNRFYPTEVKLKYSGNDSENDSYYGDLNKLVEPSENMKFTILEEPKIKDDLVQNNDFIKKDGGEEKVKKMFIIKKIPDKTSEGEIDVYLTIKLDSEKIIEDDDDEIEESLKPSGASLFKIAANMIKNIQQNLKCDNAKKEFKKDASDIYEIFKNKLGSQEFKASYVAKTNVDDKTNMDTETNSESGTTNSQKENVPKTIATIIPINKNVSFIKRQIVKRGGKKNRTLKKRKISKR